MAYTAESNEDLEAASCDDESDQEEGDAGEQDEPVTTATSTRRSPHQVALDQQERNDSDVDFDDDDDDDSDNELTEEKEDEYAAIILEVSEPAAVSDKNDQKMDQQEHVDAEEEDFALIGASVDDKWTWSKQKRVLSSNTLAALNREAGRNADLPKRIRSLAPAAEPSGMPELSLGMPSFDETMLLPKHDVIRDDSPLPSSDDEEDKMLSEELEEKPRDSGGDNSPIPLLTPPQSPRREDEVEWPSNLVIDSALMNTVNELRPLSPASLQNMEEEEEQRLRSHDVEASSLTPLLRSIYVGTT